jgi:hypothetical protein
MRQTRARSGGRGGRAHQRRELRRLGIGKNLKLFSCRQRKRKQ